MVGSRELNRDGILVANDEVAENETQQMALKMAVPSGVNVLIRSIDEVAAILKDKRAKKKNLLVLVRTIQDAYRLAERVKNMSYINIGNVGKSVEGNKKTLTQFVMLTEKELVSLEKLVKIYPETALQNVPSDKKELAKSFIK
jgi:PTS system mannose-specific IIB component